MMSTPHGTRTAGYTLTEIMITLAIVAVAIAIAIPSLNRATENSDLRETALSLDGAFQTARGEAMRTGDVQLFFVFQDAEGNPLFDPNGDQVPVLIVNDGAPGSANQNCKVDGGERTIAVSKEAMKKATDIGAPAGGQGGLIGGLLGDLGMGDATQGGFSFADPAGNNVTYVMFRPEGMPIAFDANCNLGGPGSGAGTVYMNNGDRSYAVALSPMGTTKVLSFNNATGAWE